MSVGSEFAASVSVGDRLSVGTCGGTVARVETGDSVCDRATAALIFFESYGMRRGGTCWNVTEVLRVGHDGFCCAETDSGSGCARSVGHVRDASHRVEHTGQHTSECGECEAFRSRVKQNRDDGHTLVESVRRVKSGEEAS